MSGMGPDFRGCCRFVGRKVQERDADTVQPTCGRKARRRCPDLTAKMGLVHCFELIILVTARIGLGDSNSGPIEQGASRYRCTQGRTELFKVSLELLFDLEVVLA